MGIALGATAALVPGLLLTDHPGVLLLVAAGFLATLLVLLHPRLRRVWDLLSETVTAAGFTTVAFLSGGAASPVRHLLAVPVAYAAMTRGPRGILAIFALVAMLRSALNASSEVTVATGAELVAELGVWLLIGLAVYLLRLSLARSTERLERFRGVSTRRLRAMAENAPVGIYLLRLGDEPRFDYVNPALARLSLVDVQTFYDEPTFARTRVHPDDVERLRAARATMDAWDEPVRIRWLGDEGEVRWHEIRESPYEDDDGVVVGVQGVVHDVTDVVEAQQAAAEALAHAEAVTDDLRRASEMKDVFLQSVSHELRTPLASVVGLSATVRDRLPDLADTDAERLLARVVVNAEKLQRLLTDLLDVDRLARGAMLLEATPTDIAQVAARVLGELTPDGKRIDSHLEPVIVDVDGPKVERVVENLVHNALRHTPLGATVWVRVEEHPDGGALITVEDDGPGVPPQLRDAIREPFVQGPASARSPRPGTGIGLSLVDRLVALHGGTLVIGDRPGGGARFEVRLPSALPAPSDVAVQVPTI